MNMLFKDLKNNYPVFIFDRNDVSVKEGKVVNIGIPHYDLHYNTSAGMVTDVTIKVDDVTKTYTFKDASEVGYADNLVISPNRDSILREVEIIKDQSEQALKMVETHKANVEKCDKILSEFNPAFKEKQENEERFFKLESSVGEIKNMIFNFMNKLNANGQTDIPQQNATAA